MEIERTTSLRREDYDRLARIYMDCFSEHPWYEKFNRLEVKSDLMKLANEWDNLSFVARKDGLIAGALFSIPLIYADGVAEFVHDKIDKDRVMYVAEVFVRRKFRRRGIASGLLEKVTRFAHDYMYTHIVQRTNFDSKMFPLIEKTGYKLVGIQTVMSKKVMGRAIAEVPEKRGIFLKEL